MVCRSRCTTQMLREKSQGEEGSAADREPSQTVQSIFLLHHRKGNKGYYNLHRSRLCQHRCPIITCVCTSVERQRWHRCACSKYALNLKTQVPYVPTSLLPLAMICDCLHLTNTVKRRNLAWLPDLSLTSPR